MLENQSLPGALGLVSDETLGVCAPDIMRGEVLNTLLGLRRRRILEDTQLDGIVQTISGFAIKSLSHPDWPDRALAIARRFSQGSIFDAVYLACAEDLDAELWTADRRFVNSFGLARPERLKLCPDDL